MGGKEECVIRDIWALEGTLSEKDIRKKLVDSINCIDNIQSQKQDMDIYEDHFLTHWPEASGPVTPSHHPIPTSPFTGEIEGSLDIFYDKQLPPDPYYTSQLLKSIIPRKHYHDIYSECCQHFESLGFRKIMFQTLLDCTKGREQSVLCSPLLIYSLALSLLSKHGFVHRDISTGNILWDTMSRTGCLSDLEYMKRVNEQDDGPTKTVSGTVLRC